MTVQQSSDTVALTGCGWVTPFAAGSIADVLDVAENVLNPTLKDGICWAVPNEILDGGFNLCREITSERVAWMSAVAIEHTLRSASLSAKSLDSDRAGLILGCAAAGMNGMIAFAGDVREKSARFVSPIQFPQTVGNYPAGALARAYGLRGPNITIASGSASGLDAIIEGCSLLAAGRADLILAGGTEQWSRGLLNEESDPNVHTSEGSCWFVLERVNTLASRKVRPLATVTRWQRLSDNGGVQSTAGDTVRSSASKAEPGCIFAPHWVGRSGAAAGPAAIAAAIGVTHGHRVPVVDAGDARRVSISQVEVASTRSGSEGRDAIVFAEADGDHCSILELAIPGAA